MALRKYSNPRELDVSRGLQGILAKNGMQAHISFDPNKGYQLIVLGHDSPVMAYKLNDKQLENLMGWGSSYENKKAYNTFTEIVKNDFDVPKSFMSATNAFGRVAMGLHGYRIGNGEYGYNGRSRSMPWYSPFHRKTRGWGGDFIGWAPRTQGFHLRRIGNHVYSPWDGNPIIPERPDGRFKPGELQSGGYGFYYKGKQQGTSVDVLDTLSIEPKIKPLEAAPRPKGQGQRYSDVIASDVYFTNDKFLAVLKSHGVVINLEKKNLTIQSELSKVDLAYNLTDDEVKKLNATQISGTDGVSVAERLAIINDIIKVDFSSALTKEMLETKDLVPLELKPDVRAEVEAPFVEQERKLAEQARQREISARINAEKERIQQDPNAINGKEIQDIMGNKRWFQPIDNGREMVVGEIRVDRTVQGVHVMTAEINGRLIAHKISEKDYDKFLDLDDKHRLKMFDSVFKEVKIKSTGSNFSKDDMYASKEGRERDYEGTTIAAATSTKVDGQTLSELNRKEGFYRERTHGREIEVGNIEVNPTAEGKYKMTAVINGESLSHEITQKDYDKFLALDDYHRIQLFSKIFNEVDIKVRPEERTHLGAALLAALTVTGEVVAGLMMGPEPGRGPKPSIFEERSATHYYKPGVNSPADVLAAEFRSLEAQRGPNTNDGVGIGR